MHARPCEVLPDRLRHRDHRRLRRRVGRGHRVALLACDRRDVDDPAVAALDHARDDRAVAVEDAVGVDPHHAPPLLVGDVDGRERRAGHACRADEDVDRAELVLRACDRGVDVGRVARRRRSEREHAVRCLRSEIEGRDARAFVEESARDGSADAARPAGDERHPARESFRVAHGSQRSLESERHGLRSDRDYPLGTRRPDLVATPGACRSPRSRSRRLRAGTLAADEIRATPETLRAAGRGRARGRPDAARREPRARSRARRRSGRLLLDVYTALRPGRATAAELEEWAVAARGARRGDGRGVRAGGRGGLRRAGALLADG